MPEGPDLGVLVTPGGAGVRLGAGTMCGVGAEAGADVAGSPCSRTRLRVSCGGRVATTRRGWAAAGGLTVAPDAGITLAPTGLMSRGPCTGTSWRTSPCETRVGLAVPRLKWSLGTPITALFTWTFRYTLMWVTFTVVWRLTTT